MLAFRSLGAWEQGYERSDRDILILKLFSMYIASVREQRYIVVVLDREIDAVIIYFFECLCLFKKLKIALK